mgnify:CR=1 FL=1
METIKEPMVVISKEHCKSCQLCITSCPKGVLELSEEFNHLGYHPARYKGTGCIGCGICYYTCPEPGAITVYKKGHIITEKMD